MNDFEEAEEASGGAGWMATFADMMTLLLTFFILLLSFATMDAQKFRDAMGSVQEALGVQFIHDGTLEGFTSAPIQLFDQEAAPRPAVLEDQALLRELRDAIRQERLNEEMVAEISGRGVIVQINGQLLYEEGQATVRLEANPILNRIADLINRTEHLIMIEGHTDDLPINTARFPSNWELSTARAIAAMRFLVDQSVPPARMGVAGYADLRPIQPNDTAEHRAANRRVEFVFIRKTEDPEQVTAG